MNTIEKQQKHRADNPGGQIWRHELVDCKFIDHESQEMLLTMVNLSAGRLTRKAHARGLLQPFEGHIPTGHRLTCIGSRVMLVPERLAQKDKSTPDLTSVFTDRRESIQRRQKAEVVYFLEKSIARPYIKLTDTSFERDKEPTLTLSHTWRTDLQGQISLPRNWKTTFELSNEKFIVISIIETEQVSEDITLYHAKAWSKESIRKAEPKVEEVWVGKAGSTTSITKSRSTALRGASIRTKNEIVRQIW